MITSLRVEHTNLYGTVPDALLSIRFAQLLSFKGSHGIFGELPRLPVALPRGPTAQVVYRLAPLWGLVDFSDCPGERLRAYVSCLNHSLVLHSLSLRPTVARFPHSLSLRFSCDPRHGVHCTRHASCRYYWGHSVWLVANAVPQSALPHKHEPLHGNQCWEPETASPCVLWAALCDVSAVDGWTSTENRKLAPSYGVPNASYHRV